jgi:hypothetical protein
MAVKLLDESLAEQESRAEAAIRKGVHEVLNRKGLSLRVRVSRLWDNHYRVNVYAGTEGPSATITHSYFMVVDAAGAVVESTPVLRRPPVGAGPGIN